MSNYGNAFFGDPKDTIIGAANELTQTTWELNELASTFARLGMAPIAEELRNHSATIERVSSLIRRAATQTMNR